MTFLTFLLASAGVILPICGLVALIWLLLKKTSRDYFERKLVLQNRINIGELFITIDFIVKIECDLFEQYFERNTTADMTTLTNSEFTNIYNELSMRCLKAVSPMMWDLSEVYMNREEVQTYITQKVMTFLLEKSTVTEDEEEPSAP